MPDVRHGRVTQLLLQRQTQSRTAPTPAAFLMKYNPGFEFGNDDDRQEDPTINNLILMEKMDAGDPAPSGNLPAILCLNDIGQWLSLLWGPPVTTGTGDPYTHTFTCSLDPRPFALLELAYLESGNERYEQWLDVVVNTLAWNVLDKAQSIQVGLMGAVQVDPAPSAVFDNAPTAYAKDRAVSQQGVVADVIGSSTLGEIVEASVNINNDFEADRYGDGLPGIGAFLLGQPAITGTMRGVFDVSANNLFEHAQGNVSKALKLVSKNEAGDHSLTLNIPQIGFKEPKHKIESSKGLHVDVDWYAHADASPPTIELVNGIDSYA